VDYDAKESGNVGWSGESGVRGMMTEGEYISNMSVLKEYTDFA
jgi:hypothetical protein